MSSILAARSSGCSPTAYGSAARLIGLFIIYLTLSALAAIVAASVVVGLYWVVA